MHAGRHDSLLQSRHQELEEAHVSDAVVIGIFRDIIRIMLQKYSKFRIYPIFYSDYCVIIWNILLFIVFYPMMVFSLHYYGGLPCQPVAGGRSRRAVMERCEGDNSPLACNLLPPHQHDVLNVGDDAGKAETHQQGEGGRCDESGIIEQPL